MYAAPLEILFVKVHVPRIQLIVCTSNVCMLKKCHNSEMTQWINKWIPCMDVKALTIRYTQKHTIMLDRCQRGRHGSCFREANDVCAFLSRQHNIIITSKKLKNKYGTQHYIHFTLNY